MAALCTPSRGGCITRSRDAVTELLEEARQTLMAGGYPTSPGLACLQFSLRQLDARPRELAGIRPPYAVGFAQPMARLLPSHILTETNA